MVNDLNGCIDLYYAAENKKIVEDCPEAVKQLSNLQYNVNVLGTDASMYYITKITFCAAEIGTMVAALIGAIPSAGVTLIGAAVSAGLIVADMAAANAYQGYYRSSMDNYKSQLNSIRCKPKDDENKDDEDEKG